MNLSTLKPSLVWFRRDLRLSDHYALQAALAGGGPVIPVFVWTPNEEGVWAPGAASRWWLHHALKALQLELARYGVHLLIRQGESALEELNKIIAETGAKAIFWQRCYEPALIARDQQIKTELRGQGLEVHSFNASLMREPWELKTQGGKPYQVFTPFWRAWQNLAAPAEPLAPPEHWELFPHELASCTIEALDLLPKLHWAQGLQERWRPGVAGAQAALEDFLNPALGHYEEGRNRPDLPLTSRLSPYLHFGELSPRELWHALRLAMAKPRSAGVAASAQAFLRELGWREFAYHLLYYFPQTPTEPLKPHFKDFPWSEDEAHLRAWQRGRTGYPLVDAGMRQLWQTGWMHNRVRMIVASFLVKDLKISWLKGAQWFWDTLVDADLANNTLGWQWSAGCGADAAPFFRILNPTAQAQKFDPEGDYIRRYVPELAGLAAPDIFEPWKASPLVLARAGVSLGQDYPRPIVDHGQERARALEIFQRLKSKPGH